MSSTHDNFKYIFWYIVGMCTAILLIIVGVIFIPIPKENQRNADTAIAFLFGLMTGCAAFLIGSGPTAKKPDLPPGTTTTTDAVVKTVTTAPDTITSPTP